MKRARVFAIAVLAAAWGAATPAQAQGDPDVDGFDDSGAEDGAGAGASGEASLDTGGAAGGQGGEAVGENTLTLPAGGIRIDANLMINLSTDNAFQPVSLGPDVWYGVIDKLTAGLVHSNYGTTGFYGTVATFSATGGAFNAGGLCLTGEENGCAKLYDNVGGRALYEVSRSDDLVLAADGGLVANSFDPFLLQLRAGAKGRFRSGKIGLEFNPAVHIGLTEGDFNSHDLLIPVSVGYSATPEIIAGIQTGVRGSLSAPGDVGFGDTWSVPLTFGARYQLDPNMGLGAGFTLPYLLVNETLGNFVDPFDARVLDIIFSYEM